MPPRSRGLTLNGAAAHLWISTAALPTPLHGCVRSRIPIASSFSIGQTSRGDGPPSETLAHETHARERSRDRRERPDVPHSARPMSLFRIGQSQAKSLFPSFIQLVVGHLSNEMSQFFVV